MKISDNTQAFILHFGEMGSRWGFNRTVAQILALLVVQAKPVNADDIASLLHISRGNVSMGLKELQSWRLLRLERIPGDRKDYYTIAGSIWDMARIVFEERRKREIDPTLTLLRSIALSPSADDSDTHTQNQAAELLDFLELITQWGDQLNKLSPEQLQRLMKLGSGISKVLDFTGKISAKKTSE